MARDSPVMPRTQADGELVSSALLSRMSAEVEVVDFRVRKLPVPQAGDTANLTDAAEAEFTGAAVQAAILLRSARAVREAETQCPEGACTIPMPTI